MKKFLVKAYKPVTDTSKELEKLPPVEVMAEDATSAARLFRKQLGTQSQLLHVAPSCYQLIKTETDGVWSADNQNSDVWSFFVVVPE